MPIDPNTGICIPFTPAQIEAMNIRTFKVRDQSHPTERREVGSSTAQRVFLVDWEQRYNFMELVLGNANAYLDADDNLQLSRLLPDPTWGVWPGYPKIIATKILDSRGFGKNLGEDADNLPLYPSAQVTVGYELVPWCLLDDEHTMSESQRYVIQPQSGDSEADYVTLPGGVLQYIVQGGTAPPALPIPHLKKIQFNLGKVFPTQSRTWTWVRLPPNAYFPGSPLHTRLWYGSPTDNPPYSVPFIGTINSEAVFKYNVGTMLLEKVSEKINRDVLGQGDSTDLYFQWSFRPTGWNWMPFYDPTTNADGTPTNPKANGIYFIGKSNTVYTADVLPDDYSLYNARPHMTGCFEL